MSRDDAATNTVTLRPSRRLYLHTGYVLRVNGTTASGLTDTSGRLLDGAGTGSPGSDFVSNVTFDSLAGASTGQRTRAASAHPAGRRTHVTRRRR